MSSYQILDRIEMVEVKPTRGKGEIGSKYFDKDLQAVLDVLEIGKGLVVPYREDCTKGYLKGQLAYYAKKFGEMKGKEFEVIWEQKGFGILRKA